MSRSVSGNSRESCGYSVAARSMMRFAKGEDEACLTQRFKGDLLSLGLLGLEPTQDFIPGHDRKGEPLRAAR